MPRFVARVKRGGSWDWSRDMREQDGWDDHASFMNGLFDEGFLLMVGPLEGDRETLWIVEAESEAVIRKHMAEDPWSAKRHAASDAHRALECPARPH